MSATLPAAGGASQDGTGLGQAGLESPVAMAVGAWRGGRGPGLGHDLDTLPTRRSLIERLRNRDDRTGWQDFFDTYWRLIYGVARRAGLADAEAQDVVQDTVIAVARGMDGFKNDPAHGSFKSWLLVIARRRIADQFRRRNRLSEFVLAHADDTARTPLLERYADPAGLEAVWDEEWGRNLMEMALENVKRRVSSKQFLLFHQQVVKQWPPRKVSEKYGVSLAQVYMAKYRIGGLVKRELRRLERELA